MAQRRDDRAGAGARTARRGGARARRGPKGNLPELGGWPADRLDGATYDGRVLWVGGDRSPYIRAEHAEVMDRWFPRNRRVTIKGAGHWVHSEQPEVFVEVLRRFV